MGLILWISIFEIGSLFWSWLLFWGGAEMLEGFFFSGASVYFRAKSCPQGRLNFSRDAFGLSMPFGLSLACLSRTCGDEPCKAGRRACWSSTDASI